ncbi:hypothetical protein XA68_10911 [Ophiocordyceps unilateralis]|uniref:BSD domain-containing protein n=1 Tax=Ophiocordyceps unilateralis TaxID=268505 RepID=A0A2A9NY17_OPHUN|nr:hypothetical protein XA68_10911 [Ophiocordyceps unilateralis]
MDAPIGRTLFKKRDGILSLTSDHTTVTWTPTSTPTPTISLPQTPDSSPKVMLKIFEKGDDEIEPTTYLFHFHSPDARADAKRIKDILSRLLADVRSADTSLSKPSSLTVGASDLDGGGGVSASMAFANAANSQPFSSRWFDDGQLKADIELQQSLMKKDKSLHQTYMEAMTTKPQSISGASFNSQRKVQLILAQHPLVKRIYNENVPKLSEADFWSRFFLSRLSKILRGERVTENDRTDALFDQNNVIANADSSSSKIMRQTVPHMINLEANEENQGGFKGGNALDVEMRPRGNFHVVKTLNSLSEKIMANVSPSDIVNNNEQGQHDGYGGELSLRDLKGDALSHRITLNVNEQKKFFSKQESAPSVNGLVLMKQDPAVVLARLRSIRRKIEPNSGEGTTLQTAVHFNDASESEEEAHTLSRVGSRAAIKSAEVEVMNGILQQRAQELGHLDDASSPLGLPPQLTEKCSLTHATTVEFLHQFWNAFLSGDPERALELQYLAESLRYFDPQAKTGNPRSFRAYGQKN